MDFFYDEQIRRLILQVTRAFGGFVVHTGKGGALKTKQIRQVPVRYGAPSRMIGHILRLQSEVKILHTPFMSVHINAINMAPDRRQNPNLISTHQVDERKFNDETEQYEGTIGDRFKFRRFMPVPYNFTFQLDIWTSNTNEKLQLIEQIMMLFNPSIDLQTSDNPLDWTAITFIEMQDSIQFSSRQVPLGDSEEIEVASLQFLVPYWINPPAEITQRKVIETIIANVRAVDELPADDTDFEWSQGDLLSQIIITPNDHQLLVDGNELTLLGANGATVDDNGDTFSWEDYLNLFGEFTQGSSIITVKEQFGDADGIFGTFVLNPSQSNKLIWTIDHTSIPVNTLAAIDAIIDPTTTFPGDGKLASADANQRYLLANDIGGPTVGWGILTASANDIIEFDGSHWFVDFDSSLATAQEVVLNFFSLKQFRYDPTDDNWTSVSDGTYRPGTWKVTL